MPAERRLSSPTRRAFIAGASAFALGAATSPHRALALSPGDGAWRGLAAMLRGRLLRPGDPGFAAAAMPFNLRYARRAPAGIAICRDAEDVAKAIVWARDNGLPFAARCGGHSYAGYSTTSGLLIALDGLDSVSVDAAGVATIGGGARNETVYAALEKAGATITHGRCPSVGAAGFVLGGGIGFNMRLFGLACDQLEATELVGADGAIHTASATDNPDLFWACRGGGGGNFGINTMFRLRTFPAEPRTYFWLDWPNANERLLAALIGALDTAPPTLGSRLSLDTSRDRPGVSVRLIGQIAGTRSEALAILDAPLKLEAPEHNQILTVDYWAAESVLVDSDGPFSFHERSRFVTEPLGEDFAGVAMDWMRRWPGTGGSGDLVLFQTGGKINEIAPDATAFVHRDSRWLLVVSAAWSQDDPADVVDRARAWQDGFYADLLRFARGGAYQNFTDPALEDWAEAYYGANLPRLRAVKRALDPDNVFRFAQSIPLA
ncbi:MAG TPA: FAD-binding oxidoreductase [Bauldia sp.]|nr:FAD-binding oxidoreductase [Bauldia sp.]